MLSPVICYSNEERVVGKMKKDEIEKAFSTYYRPLFLYAFSLTKSKAEAEDLVINAFVKAMLSFKKGSLKNWLFAVMKNEFINHYRSSQKLLDEGEVHLEWIQDSTDLLSDLIYDQQKQWLYQKIYELPEKEREVMLLSVQSDLKDVEIAQMMNLTTENVRVIRHRVKQKLIMLCEKEGIK